MQARHRRALEPVSEPWADHNSYGLRPERSTADAREPGFITVSRKKSAPQWILEGDLQGCLDPIRPEGMREKVPTDQTLLQKWLKAG